jgi:predicted nucleic acid-binding protein
VRIVVDANVVLAQALELRYAAAARSRFARWIADDAPLFAPSLWHYEVASALRKVVVAGTIAPATAAAMAVKFCALGIRDVAPSAELQERALAWAAALDAPVAYDAAYLAAAESLGAELWTADGKLARAAAAVGVAWVRQIEEAT